MVQLWPQVSRALSEHVLPSRNPYTAQRKMMLLDLPDVTFRFHLRATPAVCHDLFSDGSCAFPAIPELSRASWAAVSATHEAVLSAGMLPGLQRYVDRAELTAALSAAYCD